MVGAGTIKSMWVQSKRRTKVACIKKTINVINQPINAMNYLIVSGELVVFPQRCPPRGGLVQGWESVRCGVVGIPLLENEK